jgi:hypothetical protein
MIKAQIMAQLLQLNPEEVAEIRAFLDELQQQMSAACPPEDRRMARRVPSPRLGEPSKASQFIKHVIELS